MTKQPNKSDSLPKKFIQKLDTLKQSVSLSCNETQAMRERLVAYADMHVVPPRTNIASAFVFSYKSFYSRAFVAGLLIFILIITAATSVTYAAGNVLPGQPLYPIKVNVAEPIEGAVIAATGNTSELATWQNTLAERRIAEATTLASENMLATSTQAYLESQAEIHIARSEAYGAKLAAAGDVNEADAIRTDLEARLATHAKLLARIAPRLVAAGDATSTSQVATLLNDIRQTQGAISSGQDGEVSSVSSSSPVTASSTASTSPSSIRILKHRHNAISSELP